MLIIVTRGFVRGAVHRGLKTTNRMMLGAFYCRSLINNPLYLKGFVLILRHPNLNPKFTNPKTHTVRV